jgi:hypothetical protein
MVGTRRTVIGEGIERVRLSSLGKESFIPFSARLPELVLNVISMLVPLLC